MNTNLKNNEFGKYQTAGAYHWNALTRDIRRHHLFTRTRYDAVVEAAEVQEGQSLCDYGCGDGALTYLLWQRNRSGRITGVEPDSLGRSLAAEMFGKHGAQAAFIDSSRVLADNSQDLVVCAEVVEHVEDAQSFLAELNRILKPGGRCVISTPIRLTEQRWDKEHFREYFPGEFVNLLSGYFVVLNNRPCCSALATELYEWRPSLFLKRPVFAYVMNLLSLWCGINLVRTLNPAGRLWCCQVASCIKKPVEQAKGAL